MSQPPLDPRLHAWLDGELEGEALATFERELESNADLAAALDDLKRQRAALREPVAVSKEFEAALLNRLQPRRPAVTARIYWIAGSAAAGILMVFLFVLSRQDPSVLPDPGSSIRPQSEKSFLSDKEVFLAEEAEEKDQEPTDLPAKEKLAASPAPPAAHVEEMESNTEARVREMKKNVVREKSLARADEYSAIRQESGAELVSTPLPDWVRPADKTFVPDLFPLPDTAPATVRVLYDPQFPIDCDSPSLRFSSDGKIELTWKSNTTGGTHACRLEFPNATLPDRLIRLPGDSSD
jgi:hypothetical protein